MCRNGTAGASATRARAALLSNQWLTRKPWLTTRHTTGCNRLVKTNKKPSSPATHIYVDLAFSHGFGVLEPHVSKVYFVRFRIAADLFPRHSLRSRLRQDVSGIAYRTGAGGGGGVLAAVLALRASWYPKRHDCTQYNGLLLTFFPPIWRGNRALPLIFLTRGRPGGRPSRPRRPEASLRWRKRPDLGPFLRVPFGGAGWGDRTIPSFKEKPHK